MATEQQKRRRKAAPKPDINGEYRPLPPPPPPSALISLLKKDKDVTEYFRALHINLIHDVMKWKKRARAYKEELKKLQHSKRPRDIFGFLEHEQNKKQKILHGKNPGVAGTKGQPETQINDPAFELDLSSSSEGNYDDVIVNRDIPTPLPSVVARDGNPERSCKIQRNKGNQDSLNDTNSKVNENYQKNDVLHFGSCGADDLTVVMTSNTSDHRSDRWCYPQYMDEKNGHGVTIESQILGLKGTSFQEQVPSRIRIGWEFLRRAEDYLKEIGIVLVTTRAIDKNDDDADDSGSIDCSSKNHVCRLNHFKTDCLVKRKESQTIISYIRRIDSVVLGDIIQTIKHWTKLRVIASFPAEGIPGLIVNASGGIKQWWDGDDHTDKTNRTFKYRYSAFVTRGIIPCFVPVNGHFLGGNVYRVEKREQDDRKLDPFQVPQHPAVRGVEILVTALAWIDSFGPILNEIEINSEVKDSSINNHFVDLVQSGNETVESEVVDSSWSSAKLFVRGMKKRYNMVRSFVKSLEGEICEAWPMKDRSSRTMYLNLHSETHTPDDSMRYQSHDDIPGGDTKSIWDRRRTSVQESMSSVRLAIMVERCILARIVTAIYLHRNDIFSALSFLFRYILMTVPSIKYNDHPEFQPVISLLMIETILNTPLKLGIGGHLITGRTLLDYLQDGMQWWDSSSDNTVQSRVNRNKIDLHPLFESLQLSLAVSAAIFRLRTMHEDTRISEPAFVEVAAYQRIALCFNKGCAHSLSVKEISLDNLSSLSYSHRCRRITMWFLEEYSNNKRKYTLTSILTTLILPITMMMQENNQELQTFERLEIFLNSNLGGKLFMLKSCSKAIRQIELRNIDCYRTLKSSISTLKVAPINESIITRLCNSIIGKSAFEHQDGHTTDFDKLSTLLVICNELADGENSLRLIQHWLETKSIKNDYQYPSLKAQEKTCFVNHWSSFPMIRVINLERRQDRMTSFRSRVMYAGLWAIRGVIPPNRWRNVRQDQNFRREILSGLNGSALTSSIGTYAMDGSRDLPGELERKIVMWLKPGVRASNFNKREINSLVRSQWRPSDLKVFDTNAPDDPNLNTYLSPSEKACALSHVATWKGIALSSSAGPFTFAGFARGDPIQTSSCNFGKDDLPVCPVAMVLEDDAVLVERFQYRLDQLLKELPRDFHYCALGYAKPKEAPLVDIPGCKYIKLPTMTWYLTGYLLSQAGAQYLLDRLPIVGPIDAWIGQEMILKNWENDYGHHIGVGKVPQNRSDSVKPTLTRREIRMCLRFRAYCSGIPLCDQKMKTETTEGTCALHHDKPLYRWQLRDSDIVYSGNVGQTNGKRMINSHHSKLN